MATKLRLPAEWEQQSVVQLTFPHAATDWSDILAAATDCFVRIAQVISTQQRVLIVHHPQMRVEHFFSQHERANITCVAAETNDTWARDHAPITVMQDGKPILLNFQFNGWGLKFAADRDNLLNSFLYQKGIFKTPLRTLNMVLEGGSIESDGAGTILTTTNCLLSPNRNPEYRRVEVTEKLKTYFGAQRILWLEHGHLVGDDTDAHIDTLARFCNLNTIAYVQCLDKKDEHFMALRAMEQELQTFRTTTGEPYQLIPLPLAEAIYNEEGQRLPATYANFLIINKLVLLPIYQVETDELAIRQLQKCFPQRKVVPVDCRVLIEQNGSLHCVTMQYPVGVEIR